MSLKGSDVVVTGGAGAIGTRVVARALASGARRVVIIDDLSSGYAWLIPADERVHFVQDTITRVSELDLGVLDQPYVFHLAAFFANQNSVDHPQADLETNGKGTLAVLEWAARLGARRVVYASAGCSIAGHGIDAPIQEDMPVSLFLDTPYQITKALGEFYCNYFLSSLSTVRCRFFNSYGPGEVPGVYRNVIPNFIWRALHDEPLVITGTGRETRDFIFVDDLVEGLVRSAEVAEAHGQAINLGTGIQTHIDELARMIIELTGSRSEITFAPRRAWDHSVRRQADISRAGAVLGLQPAVGVPEGLRRTVAWFAAHRDRIAASVGPDALGRVAPTGVA